MLNGKAVNLRVAEKEDLPDIGVWRSNPDFQGEYNLLIQESTEDLKKRYENLRSGEKWFVIEKKDGATIGLLTLELVGGVQEMGYGIIPNERRKGYCTEAVKIAVSPVCCIMLMWLS